MPPKGPKRLADNFVVKTAIHAAGIKDDDWIQKVFEVDKEHLILIISLVVNKGNIDIRSIKKARTELPSFSAAKWTDFAARAGLPENPSYFKLDDYETPVHQLPPSFHESVFENSWRTQDVYQEAVDQTREESRVRILDPVRTVKDTEVHAFLDSVYFGSIILFASWLSFTAESLTSQKRLCRVHHSQQVGRLNTK
jgi:hypothetical protein